MNKAITIFTKWFEADYDSIGIMLELEVDSWEELLDEIPVKEIQEYYEEHDIENSAS